jgi:excisionase family DNA binding protein
VQICKVSAASGRFRRPRTIFAVNALAVSRIGTIASARHADRQPVGDQSFSSQTWTRAGDWHFSCEYRRSGGLPPVSNATDSQTTEPRLGRSVSIDQAAAMLNLSRRTIYNRIRDGRLQTIRTLGGSQRVLVESLHDMGFKPQAFPTSAAAALFTFRPATRN